ncbi:MAG: AAA family ATPase, partial [Bdellovibrionales bacterium]|nr:AAA family ATPase [Bdellovibrionales bacterium]
MIKYFKWNNLYSFRDEGEISFEVNQNAPKTNAFVDYDRVRLSKINSVFGANASGKTNVLNALFFIYNFIVHSFHFKDKGFFNYSPYMMNDEGSEFEVSFLIDKVCYIYSFSVNKEVVLSEKLQKKDINKDTNLKTVFKRHGQAFQNLNFNNQTNEHQEINYAQFN